MQIKPILAAAALSVALCAAPAFAQSSATKAEDYAKEKAVEEVKDKASDMATEKMKMDDIKDVAPAAEGMILKADPAAVEMPKTDIMSKDGLPKMGDEDLLDPSDIMETPEASTPTLSTPAEPTLVVIACPEGTTAQDDGTCMITGDYAE